MSKAVTGDGLCVSSRRPALSWPRWPRRSQRSPARQKPGWRRHSPCLVPAGLRQGRGRGSNPGRPPPLSGHAGRLLAAVLMSSAPQTVTVGAQCLNPQATQAQSGRGPHFVSPPVDPGRVGHLKSLGSDILESRGSVTSPPWAAVSPSVKGGRGLNSQLMPLSLLPRPHPHLSLSRDIINQTA